MDHFAVAMDLAENVKAQGAEIERLKDLVREQDRAHGTITVRAELADKAVIITAPSGDEVKIAHQLFAAIAASAYVTGLWSLAQVVGEEQAIALFKAAIDNATAEPE